MFISDSKAMKTAAHYIRFAALLAAMTAATACYQKFDEPLPQEYVEMEPTMTLAEFKALYRGYPVEITDESIVLEGRVISSDRSGNVYRSLYIEDGSAGLELKIGLRSMYNDYKLGQTIYVKPKYLWLGTYGESIQLGAASGQTIYVKPKYLWLGTYGESIQLGAASYDPEYETSFIEAPELIERTIFRGAPDSVELKPMIINNKAQVNDANVCRFVKLEGVVYQGGENGLRTWAIKQDPFLGSEAEYGQQNFKLGDMEDNIVVRTSGYASFAAEEVGMEVGQVCNLTGILTKFYDTYQLVLLDLTGVERIGVDRTE